MKNNIGQLIENQKTNPHIISRKTGLTYRVVLELSNKEYIKKTTQIGTLQAIADALSVSVSDLYEVEVETV